jgi:hypothetical protein
MDKLSRFELKVLRYLDDMVKHTTFKESAIKELTTYMGLSQEEAIDIYRLWYYNQKEGVDYSELKINRGETPLIKFVTKMSLLRKPDREKYMDDMIDNHKDELEKIYGDWFHVSCGGWKEKMPAIEWTNKGAELNLNRGDWEEHFSGLDDDSIYRYNEAFDNYSGYYDEMDTDELNYIHSYMNEETVEHFKNIALLAGKSNWPGKTTNNVNDGDVDKFLDKFLPRNHYDDIANEFLSSLSMEVSSARQNSTREQYNEEIKYNVSSNCTCGYHCITIPYNDLLYLIKNEEFITLSDLNDAEIQDEIDLNQQYYDTWLEDDGIDTVTRDLNYVLDRVIEKISEDSDIDLGKLYEKKERWEKTFVDLGFVQKYSRQVLTNKNINLWFNIDNVDYKNDKIKIHYNDKSHIIPLENLSDWALGGVLDLNEGIKYGKRLLNESIENITKISIFDFDGTLMRTPHPEEGKNKWENFYNKKYPHIGWWSKPESLDDAVFNIEPIESTINDYKKEKMNPNTLVIMLTGRIRQLHDQIMELLLLHNIGFVEYHYKDTGDTLNSKINTIISLLNKYPYVKSIEMWEDREPHAISFEEWGKENGVDIKVNLIK